MEEVMYSQTSPDTKDESYEHHLKQEAQQKIRDTILLNCDWL